jgi:hypothetical protein
MPDKSRIDAAEISARGRVKPHLQSLLFVYDSR